MPDLPKVMAGGFVVLPAPVKLGVEISINPQEPMALDVITPDGERVALEIGETAKATTVSIGKNKMGWAIQKD